MSEQSETKEKKKGGGKRTVAVVVLIVVIAALVSIIVYLLVSRREPEEETSLRNVVVTSENVAEVLQEMENAEPVDQGYYTVSMTFDWHFADGEAVSEDAYVQNLAENTNDVYFDVFLADDEEHPIYQSPVIPRGSSLEEIKLDEPLEKGTYDGILIYHLVDEEQNTVSTLRVTVTLIVES